MGKKLGQAKFYKTIRGGGVWAALDDATNQQKKITPGAIQLKPGQFAGKRALILGAGVGGLATAYELLARKTGIEAPMLEALNRTGDLSLRTGDTLTDGPDPADFLLCRTVGHRRHLLPRGDAREVMPDTVFTGHLADSLDELERR